MRVQVFDSKTELGKAAAEEAARIILDATRKRGHARIIAAAANSQLEMIAALTNHPGIAWTDVELFHMDEYLGISSGHPASFRRWVRTHIVDVVHPGTVHYLNGDAGDTANELDRYATLLSAAPIDLAFVGFGENGHIAFNDPPVANFNDPLTVKSVTLDEACRRQQVGEGHFPDMNAVPRAALTITCPGLFRAEHWVCCVPDRRKARAVQFALEGEIATSCPASLVQRHPSATVYLDNESARKLQPPFVEK